MDALLCALSVAHMPRLSDALLCLSVAHMPRLSDALLWCVSCTCARPLVTSCDTIHWDKQVPGVSIEDQGRAHTYVAEALLGVGAGNTAAHHLEQALQHMPEHTDGGIPELKALLLTNLASINADLEDIEGGRGIGVPGDAGADWHMRV